MAVFITGATGFIGQKLALKLAENGHTVHALVRNTQKASVLLQHKNIRLFAGDILDKASIQSALLGCHQIYHLAALASVWHPNSNMFYTVNVKGFQNVLDCALVQDIKDVLFTSTAGVVGHSLDLQPVSETTNQNPHLETLYEKSKVEAELLLKQYNQKGIRGIIVNPSRVYGPGLLTESNGITRLLKMYINNKWKVKPGNGKSIGNYVYIDDVVEGMILAMEKAKPGERYLLGGININYQDFFNLVDEITSTKRKLYNLPLPVMLFISHILLLLAKSFGIKPLITPAFVRKYNKHWTVNPTKAEKELGYKITPIKEGITKTLAWLNAQVN
ncbi:NAD-dependent epimerase/dehydratase family protein [uncultured Mucilaginibacter sp.]|uniref:NAD-dependent epimerase/dehydratase family protein n=1 Tax=uncultured Mucilaginibacter sp. TaxID=797541 RepID=UPI00262E8C5A|nr:NAD-dependent epimerase/dehydratase family protein [uncultured Mucilaginibacter sp.]